jgi:tetratricopeptide (TPR) repeat protein
LVVAREILARYAVETDPDGWQQRPQFRALPPDHRDQLRIQIGDLLLTLSRQSEREAADDRKPPAERDAAARSSRWYAGLATRCFPDSDKARNRRELDQLARKAGEGRWAEVLPRLKEITQQDPKDAYAWSLRGYCLFHSPTQEHWSEASDSYTHCLALQPDNAWAYFSRGVVRLRQGNFGGAVADFDQVIQLRPEHLDLAEVYASRALAQASRKNYPDAFADLEAAAKNGYPRGRASFERARIEEQMGDVLGAEYHYAQALRQEPVDVYGYVERGLARYLNYPEGALSDFDKALDLNPRSAQALRGKASVLSEKLHRLKEALPVYDQLVKDYPEDLEFRAGRAVLLARLGDFDTARREARAIEQRLGQARDDVALFLRYQLGSLYAITAATRPEDRREALRLIASAFAKGFQHVEYLDVDDDLKPIRDEADFRKLAQIIRGLFQAGS